MELGEGGSRAIGIFFSPSILGVIGVTELELGEGRSDQNDGLGLGKGRIKYRIGIGGGDEPRDWHFVLMIAGDFYGQTM